MADGGGINLRLSLKGAEQVRAELANIGPAGSKMGRELDRALRQPSAGLKALDVGVREARTGVEGFAARAGPTGTMLQSLGGWGLAAAAAFAAVAVAAGSALQLANQATQAAAAITDTADRIGVGTEALQQWRYVADEAGVPVQALEGDLEKLNGVLGKFKMGIGDAKLKPWFQELGISKSDLDSIETADELMMLLADRLGQITDRSKQVAAARAFGIEASLPALRLGADGIRDLMEASKELGVVLDAETVKKLDEADRKAELAGQQLKALAFAAVEPLASKLANMGAHLGNLSVEFGRIEANAPNWIKTFLAIGRAMPGTGIGQRLAEYAIAQRSRANGSGPGIAGVDAGVSGVDQDDPALLRQAQAVKAATGGGGFQLEGHTTSGGGGGGRSEAQRQADQRRREAERAIEGLDRDETSAQREHIREVIGQADTAAARAEVARQLLDLDESEQNKALDKARTAILAGGLMTEEVRARLDLIEDLRMDARAAKDAQIARKEAQEKREAQWTAEQAHLDLTGEILSLAAAEARTAGERRTVERALLAIAQRRQTAELELAIAAETDLEKRAELQRLMDRLPGLFKAQALDLERRTAGPFEAWKDSQIKSGPEAAEWLEAEALDALDGLNSGLIDAYKNADSAGDALTRMGQAGLDAAMQIVEGLAKIALQRMLIEPLGDALFGEGKGGSGGGGSFLGNLFSNFAGSMFGGGKGVGGGSGDLSKLASTGKKFARGGLNGSSGLAAVGEYGMEFVDMPVGARIYDADRTQQTLLDFDNRMRAMGGARGGAAAPVVNQIKVINQTSEPVTARQQQTPEGIEVYLEPLVRGTVQKMGGDGSLAKAHHLTPTGKRR